MIFWLCSCVAVLSHLACFYFAICRVIYSRLRVRPTRRLRCCDVVSRVCVNASACLGGGCVGSCPPLLSYRCVACGRSRKSSRLDTFSVEFGADFESDYS